MKKLIKVLMVASIFTLMLGTAALAAFNGGTHAGYNGGNRLHGNFSTNTSGCAGCHVTHNAEAKKLLKTGPTQTAFCESCHGGVAGSPYDVVNGKIQADVATADDWFSGNVADSYAGGFIGFSAIHDVESVTSEAIVIKPILGSDKEIFSGLKCASCHNPHRGGLESRLLRTDLPASAAGTTGTVAVSAPVMDIDGASNLPTAYVSGFSNWCGGCHDKLNKTDNSGHDKTGDPDNMYRHAMGVTPPQAGSISSTTLATGTPLESGKVACITCHRAHGSNVAVTGEAAEFSAGVEGNLTGNALLRMPNRDVCYNCHGAGEYNVSNGTN